MSRQTTEETEQNLLDLQLNLRNELFIRPFELMNIENNGIQLCDGVIDYLGHMDIVQSNFKSHIANLEQQVSDLETALIITKNSRKSHIERYANLDVEKAHLEDQNKELREALNNVILAVAEKDAGASYPRLMKCQSIAIKALKEDK